MRKLWRRLLWGGLATIVLLALLIAIFAPALANTDFVRRRVADQIARRLHRPVTLGEIDTGWFSPTIARGVTVADPDAAQPLLEVASAHIDVSLLDLLKGIDPGEVTVAGITLRIRQEPGGHTNLDDLLFPPRPKRPVRVAPKKRPPLALRISDATVHYTFLPYRRPKRFDAFREDPIIHSARDGELVVGVEGLDVRIDQQRIELAGTVRYAGDEARVEGSWDGTTGRVVLTGLVLNWAEKLTDGDVSGRADLRATYTDGALSVKMTGRDFKLDVPGLPVLDEKAIVIEGGTQPRRLSVRATTFNVSAIEADGAFRAKGELPLALATFAFGEPPADGRLFLDAQGAGGRWRGKARIEQLVFRDHALRAPPDTLSLDFDVARKGESFLRVKSRDLDGEARGRNGSVRGHFQGDLARAAPFLRLWRPDVDIAGRVKTEDVAVNWDDGTAHVRGKAELWDLDLTFEGRRYRRDHALTEWDVVVAGVFGEDIGADSIAVRRLRVDDLRAQGTVRGLRNGRFEANGEVRGTVDLAPWPGTLTLDVKANTRAGVVHVSGRAAGTGLERVGTVHAAGTVMCADKKWTGDVVARHEDGTVVLGGDLWPIGRLEVRASAARPLSELGELGELDDLVAGGVVTRPNGHWTFAGTVSGVHEHGGVFLALNARRARRDAREGWEIDVDAGSFGPAVLDSVHAFWGDDGRGVAEVKARGPLVETEGHGAVTATVSYDGEVLGYEGRLTFQETRIGTGTLDARGQDKNIAVVKLFSEGISLEGQGTLDKLTLKGTVNASRFDDRARGTFKVQARVTRDRVNGTATAARAFFAEIEARGCRVRFWGPPSKPNVLVAVRACTVDGVPVQRLSYRTRDGLLGVGRIEFGSLVWTDVSGHATVRGRVLTVPDVAARLNGGKVSGSVMFDRGATPVRWKAKVEGRDVKIDEGLGRPLSFVVPILRVRRRARRAREKRLTGLTDFDLDFAGRGTDLAALRKSLAGKGRIGLRQLQVHGSVLLPLLSLRLDRALFRRPVAFREAKVRFVVAKGSLKIEPFRMSHDAFRLGVQGTVGLDGTLDLLLHPTLPPIPLRVKGHLDRPKVRAAPFAGLFDRK